MPTTNQKKTNSATACLPEEYSVLDILGAGGTSKVALVQRESDGSQFAYKYSFPNESVVDSIDNQTENFRQVVCRELELTKYLKHPSVVPVSLVLDGAPEAGLIMPVIDGMSLFDASSKMPPTLLREVISALSMTLYYLELKSVVHGDIKPHNIFLPKEVLAGDHDFNRLFHPRLIDFSMGVLVGEAPEKRLGIGTLGYSAPEILIAESPIADKSSQRALTNQADLFSLGVSAYFLACGKHPFLEDTEDPAEIAAAVTEFSPPRLDKVISGFPTDLAKLIDSLMAKEPALRPKNGFAVCEQLEKQGALHPFRKAIQPRHLLISSTVYDVETLSTLPGFNLPARNYLQRISSGDVSKIRIILDSTFREKKIVWTDGAISAAPDFHIYNWPHRLRQWERNEFSKLTITEAKWIIRCAVAGDVVQLLQVISPPSSLRLGIANSSLVETVRGDLSDVTVKNQSRFLADTLDSKLVEDDALDLLATLQLQSEQLAASSKSAFKYCAALKSENRQIESLQLLGKISAAAEKLGDADILIETLHRDADIRRDSGDLSGAEVRYKRIVDLPEASGTRILAETYKDLGDLYKLRQDFTAGLIALTKAEALYQELNDTAELARVTNNMGNIYWIVSKYDAALNSYRQALKLHRRRNDLADISSTVNNIASVYAVTGRTDRAIHIYQLSLTMKRKLDNGAEIARTLNNLGFTFYLQGRLPEALEVLEEALEINEVESSQKEVLTNLDNFVSCAITAGRFSEALSHIRRAREIAEELHDNHSKAIFDLRLARIFLRTGRWDHALHLAQRSAVVAQELADKVLEVSCLLLQAELYRQLRLEEKNTHCVEQATKLAQEIGDKQSQIQCFLVRAARNSESLSRALELAQDTRAPRDIALCELALVECHLADGATSTAGEHLNQAAKFFGSVTEDVDLLIFERVWAEIQMLTSELEQDELKTLYVRLREVDRGAHTVGECCHSWKLEIVLAEIGSKCGEYEESYAALRRAMQSIRQLAEVLPDKESVHAFTHQPFMSRMSVEIMQLKKKLNVT